MASEELGEQQFDELLRLQRTYYREAQRCESSKSYLAGCIMLGAALEASLLTMVQCFPDEASASPRAPRKKGIVKPLTKWRFIELLAVAKERRWLPSGLDLSKAWDRRRAHIGDYAEVVRQVRNLVHPSRYLLDQPRSRLTKKYLGFCFEVLDAAAEHLQHRVLADLKERLENE